MRVLIDTNIVLDFLQERQPFIEDAAKLFKRVDTGEIEGFIAATTITNIYYIVRRAAGCPKSCNVGLKTLIFPHYSNTLESGL